MLSGVMMFDFMGWHEAAQLIEDGIRKTIQQKKVTYDFERMLEGATKVKTSEFATHMIQNMDAKSRLSTSQVPLAAISGRSSSDVRLSDAARPLTTGHLASH